MKNIIIILSYLVIFFNSNLLCEEKDRSLKVGLLAPLTGEYKELGDSLLYSLQLALEEIDDEKVFIIPRDAGFNNKQKLNNAIKDINSMGAKVIIGPISNSDFSEAKKYNDIIFISPSNIAPEFQSNVISVGISLESQLKALTKFLKKQNRKKTVIMYPENEYAKIIEKKLTKLNLKNFQKFKYKPDPQTLTGEIEVLTNYSQRKKI